MGATRWQVVWNVTLPSAVPGIMTGSILATSRAIGEAAPVLIIAGIVYIASPPGHLMDDFSVMPLQIYNWAQRPQDEFHALAATGIIVLLAVLLAFNGVAVLVRQRLQKTN
jgi:phosphate transport system permease protein